MNPSDLHIFLDGLELNCPPFPPTPENRGERLLASSKPFLSSPSERGIRTAGHLLSSPEALATHFGLDGLEEGLNAALTRTSVLPAPAPSPYTPAPFRLGDLPFFSLPGLPLTSYLTSGIVAVATPEHGLNLSYHRMQYVDEKHLVMRVVHRHLHQLLATAGGRLDAAVLLGASPAIALAAAFPRPEPGGELLLAEAITPGAGVCTQVLGSTVPVQAEMVLQGFFTGALATEGPFIDLTGTRDFERMEPLFQVTSIHCRPDPVVPMILPSGPEHALLMGLPRAVSIFAAVAPLVTDLRAVALPPGGCGWLHGVIACEPSAPPEEIASAAFRAHPSMKRLTLVNTDIDPHDAQAVEWAVATRCQPDRGVRILSRRPGSSLDPSGEDGLTAKWIIDATIPAGRNPTDFRKLL